jgi:hypothetical protein
MKANELRIGNYVNVPIQEQCPFRIDAFEYCSEKFIKVAQEVKLNGFEVHPLTWYGGDLQSIPLNEEWLLKFGFYINPNYVHPSFDEYILESGFGIGNFNDEFWLVDFLDQTIGSPKIKYVHQLQNLYFALTGEELTLKSEQ